MYANDTANMRDTDLEALEAWVAMKPEYAPL